MEGLAEWASTSEAGGDVAAGGRDGPGGQAWDRPEGGVEVRGADEDSKGFLLRLLLPPCWPPPAARPETDHRNQTDRPGPPSTWKWAGRVQHHQGRLGRQPTRRWAGRATTRALTSGPIRAMGDAAAAVAAVAVDVAVGAAIETETASCWPDLRNAAAWLAAEATWTCAAATSTRTCHRCCYCCCKDARDVRRKRTRKTTMTTSSLCQTGHRPWRTPTVRYCHRRDDGNCYRGAAGSRDQGCRPPPLPTRTEGIQQRPPMRPE